MSHVLSDALFRIKLESCMDRDVANQVQSVAALLASVQECHEDVSSRASILTADRGYEKASFMDVIIT